MPHELSDVSGFFAIEEQTPLPGREPDHEFTLALQTPISDNCLHHTGGGMPPLQLFTTCGAERGVIRQVIHRL